MSIASLYPSINPSLLLDFANSKVLDPRITFTRTTTATYYDGVTTAKAEENLFTYSQNSTTNWTNFSSRLTITTSYEAAPDGTTTGMRLVNSSGSTGYFYQNVGSNILVSGTTYTLSVYVKSNTGSSQTISLMIPDTGTTTNVTATTTWSRVSWTPTLASTNSFAGLVLSNGADISVWGFQLEQRSSATAYTATTTQAITNYIPVLQTAAAGQARFDHNPTTGESLGLLIEEARTNLRSYSADFTNAVWTTNASSITTNAVIAPDGTLTADVLVESSTTAAHYVQSSFVGVSSGASYTFTVYAKSWYRSVLQILFNSGDISGDPRANFDLSTGVLGTVDSGITATITSVGNGWYRCSCSFTTATTNNQPIICIQTSTTASRAASYAGNGFSGIFIWGAQLEAGSFATSYIPTVASTVTRNADAASMTGTNFSSWFNNGEGTLYGEMQRAQGAISGTNFHIATIGNSSSSGNYYKLRFEGSSTVRAGLSYTNGTEQCGFTQGTTTAGNFYKLCLGVKVNDFGFSSDNTTASTDTSGTVPLGLNQMIIGADVDGTSQIANNRIRKLAYYPIRVTNAQLQALTV
jgi:hypothetical protein